ncbi:hypothetical protein BC828DRAFT_417998 [Blastocladiella britannica]|nr:hypothetical protein BC828DRAFT_417998 [Blastocladiella britannica]
MEAIIVPIIVGILAVEILLYLVHRRRQRRLRAKDLADAPHVDVWYLPAGWAARPAPPVPAPAAPGADPYLASHVPTSVTRPPPTRHVANHLRTRGYVVLGVVEKWRGVPDPSDDALPRYAPVAGILDRPYLDLDDVPLAVASAAAAPPPPSSTVSMDDGVSATLPLTSSSSHQSPSIARRAPPPPLVLSIPPTPPPPAVIPMLAVGASATAFAAASSSTATSPREDSVLALRSPRSAIGASSDSIVSLSSSSPSYVAVAPAALAPSG